MKIKRTIGKITMQSHSKVFWEKLFYILGVRGSIRLVLRGRKVAAVRPFRRHSAGTILDAIREPIASRSTPTTSPTRPWPKRRTGRLSPTTTIHFAFWKILRRIITTKRTLSGRVMVIVSMTVIGAILPSDNFLKTQHSVSKIRLDSMNNEMFFFRSCH